MTSDPVKLGESYELNLTVYEKRQQKGLLIRESIFDRAQIDVMWEKSSNKVFSHRVNLKRRFFKENPGKIALGCRLLLASVWLEGNTSRNFHPRVLTTIKTTENPSDDGGGGE